MYSHQVNWKCRKSQWLWKKIAGVENARKDNEGRKYRAWRCMMWQCRTSQVPYFLLYDNKFLSYVHIASNWTHCGWVMPEHGLPPTDCNSSMSTRRWSICISLHQCVDRICYMMSSIMCSRRYFHWWASITCWFKENRPLLEANHAVWSLYE